MELAKLRAVKVGGKWKLTEISKSEFLSRQTWLLKGAEFRPEVCQEIGLARGLDMLIIPLLEEGAALPFLIEHMRPLVFREERYADAVGLLIKTLRELSRLEWPKVINPKCGEEMTQYLTPQEEVEEALAGAGWLETISSYCQNRIRLDARTFEPLI